MIEENVCVDNPLLEGYFLWFRDDEWYYVSNEFVTLNLAYHG